MFKRRFWMGKSGFGEAKGRHPCSGSESRGLRSKGRQLALACIIIITFLAIGCGVRPQVDFYVNPIPIDMEQEIDEETRLITTEKEGVSITVSGVDTVGLMNVTSDAYINPYIYVTDWGVARPRFTVFSVTVKNNSEFTVRVQPASAVLMGEDGTQYEAVPYDTLRERYSAYPGYEREIIYYPAPPVYSRRRYYRRGWLYHPWYYHYDLYWTRRPHYVQRVYEPAYLKRAVLQGTMLKSTKLYPGGKRQGFLLFPVLGPDTGELKLIIPGVTVQRGDREKRIEFQFRFERIPAVIAENDYKEDAGAGRGR